MQCTVFADKCIGRRAATDVTDRLANFRSGLERDRNAADPEVAAEVGSGGALDVCRLAEIAVGGVEHVAVEIVGIDGSARGAVGHGDHAGAQIENFAKRNRDARCAAWWRC